MIPAIILVLCAVLYRLVIPLSSTVTDTWLVNFSPLAAIVFCGAVYFPKKAALLVPMLVLLISDWLLNSFVYHVSFWNLEILPRYLAFLIVGGLALHWRAKIQRHPALLFGGSLAGSVLFYLVTNSASWLGNTFYTKDLQGLLQALWMGVPGYPPTWTFFRNSVVSDLLFTGLFWGCIAICSRKKASVSLATGRLATE